MSWLKSLVVALLGASIITCPLVWLVVFFKLRLSFLEINRDQGIILWLMATGLLTVWLWYIITDPRYDTPELPSEPEPAPEPEPASPLPSLPLPPAPAAPPQLASPQPTPTSKPTLWHLLTRPHNLDEFLDDWQKPYMRAFYGVTAGILLFIFLHLGLTLTGFSFFRLFDPPWGSFMYIIYALAFSVIGGRLAYKHNPKPRPIKPPTPIVIGDPRAELDKRLRTAIIENNHVLPTPELWERILSIGEELFRNPRELPVQLEGPAPEPGTPEATLSKQWEEKWAKADEHALAAITTSMLGFIKRLRPVNEGPFMRPILESTNPASLIYDMVQPFREIQVDELGFFRWISNRYNANVGSMSVPGELPVQPQRYEGDPNDMAEAYFRGLPQLPLLQTLVPYQPFTEINRCAHHWCLGGTRKGKTTFLRHLIKYDLEEAAKGNCSLVVMDSKGLIGEMRTLEQFAPGGPLHDKVVIIDSEPPFPLNPFKLPNAIDVVSYMLATMTDASPLQTGALRWYVEATTQMPNPSLAALQELARIDHDTKKGHLPAGVEFSKEVRAWFASTRPRLPAATSSGIAQRLDNFIRDHKNGVMRMFNADTWAAGHDLMDDLHKGGKVLLVDTDWEANNADGAEILGRLFIAFLEQLSTRRMKIRDVYKPIWVYIDEASDYLKTDSHFTQIMIKAAGQKIGMTVAYQFKGYIDRTIELALEKNAEIQSECLQRGQVNLTVEGKPLVLPVGQLEFKDERNMRSEEYEALRERLAATYPYQQALPNRSDDSDEKDTQKF
jgi:hypothetical protein